MNSETTSSTVRWFGRRWDAPAFQDALEAPTPVGEVCGGCTEPILDGEPGVTIPYAGPEGPPRIPFHTECFLRSMIGGMAHVERRCSCYGGEEHDRHSREDAVAVLAYYIDNGLGRWVQ